MFQENVDTLHEYGWKPVVISAIMALIAGFIIAGLSFDFLYLLAGLLILGISIELISSPVILILRRETIFQPITMFSAVSGGYVFGAIYLLVEKQSNPFQYHLDETNFPYFVQALFYVFIGILSFQIAYFWARKGATEKVTLSTDNNEKYEVDLENQFEGWRLAVGVLAFIGVLGYYFFVSSSGGLLNLVRNIILRNQLRTTDYYRLLFQFAQVASLLWFASDKKATKRVSFWLLVILNILMLLSLGNRGVVLLFVIQLLVLGELKSANGILSAVKRRLRRLFKVVVFVVLFLAVGVGLLAWRQASVASVRGGRFSVSEVLHNATQLTHGETFMRFLFGGANLASIEAVATIVESTPNQMSYLWGKSFFWLVLMPIPRVIWPNKPTTLGIVIKRTLFDKYAMGGGVPPSWIGELYLNFHVIGVILGSLLFGYVSAKVYDYYLKRQGNPLVQVFYTYYFVVFMFNLTKTEFRTAIIRLTGFLIALLLAYFIMKRRSQAKRQRRSLLHHSLYR